MSIRIANAPVSYGIFGDLTLGGVATPEDALVQIAAAGYAGSELGPPDFFGPAAGLPGLFERYGLAAVGAYVPLHTQGDDATLARDLDRMRVTFDELTAVGGALAILADEGDEVLLANPRHAHEYALTGQAWQRLVDVVEKARLEAAARGLRTAFHPHISTYVEQPEEIDRLLTDSDVSLCYDVAHVVMAGGDAVEHFRRWRARIVHVHVKDFRAGVFEEAVRSRRTDFDDWWARLCVPLGAGDLDLSPFLAELVASGYDGWVVVEQDRAPLRPGDLPQVVADQAANAAWLRARLG